MNDIMKNIMERKSVRNYASDPVRKEDLKAIAQAAIMAPNAMNKQNWHFTVVNDPELLKDMNEACRKGMAQCPVPMLNKRAADPGFAAFFGAPAVIVVSAGEDKFTLFDAGAASENICLAAKALGYGTCVTASTGFMFEGDPSLKDRLMIPADHSFICAITLGIETEGPDDHIRDRNLSVISYL